MWCIRRDTWYSTGKWFCLCRNPWDSFHKALYPYHTVGQVNKILCKNKFYVNARFMKCKLHIFILINWDLPNLYSANFPKKRSLASKVIFFTQTCNKQSFLETCDWLLFFYEIILPTAFFIYHPLYTTTYWYLSFEEEIKFRNQHQSLHTCLCILLDNYSLQENNIFILKTPRISVKSTWIT